MPHSHTPRTAEAATHDAPRAPGADPAARRGAGPPRMAALTPAHLLHLQRTIGNRAVGALLARSQFREPSRGLQRWSVAAIDEERDAHRDTFGGDAALHHIVAKDVLADIAAEVGRLGGLSGQAGRRWADAKEQASAFSAAVAKAWRDNMPRDAVAQTQGRLDTTLRNLPFNLEVGPTAPLGDAGTGVDVVTTATALAGGGERRTATTVSTHLAAMAESWRLYRLHKRMDDPEACAADLEAMTASLEAASEAHPVAGVAAPVESQWFEHEERQARKKEGTYFGEQRGLELFTAARNAPAAIPVLAAPLVGTANVAIKDGGTGTVRVTVDQEALKHVYERHSYAHFDFDDIKLVNAFFPHTLTIPQVQTAVGDLATQLASWLAVEVGADDWDDLDDQTKTYVTPAVFSLGKWEIGYNDDGEPEGLTFGARTIAPQQGEHYTANELQAIKDDL